MNKCYRLVFDEARGMLVPVAELKAARGKGRGRSHGGARLSAVVLLLASFGAECWPGAALAGGPPALPQNGRVVAGSAQVATPTVDQMVIEQSSQRAVIDWQSFDIGAGDTVRFAQPATTSQALNRVVGLTGSTQILGKLTANGQVFIVNPQGVVFGKGAVVDTAALLATTHDIAPSAFMAHGASLLLSGGSNGTGVVDNEGTLSTAPGGWVALVGDQVKNGGRIDVPGGTVALAAGENATLALANGQLVSLELDRAVANAQVIDSGTIAANGAAGRRAGQVIISADTAQSLLGQAINITGVVQAGGATSGGGAAERGGQITVDGGANGTVSLRNATLTVAATAGGGGQVSVAGRQVTLYDAQLNASGGADGGTILAGGANAGVTAYGSTLAVGSSAGRGGTAVLTGSTVSVLAGSHIDASGRSGGGTVIVGGDKLGKVADLMCVTLASRTVVDGTSAIDISSSGGNGGFLETSGSSVDIAGTVIARSHGASGQWLIDPDNLIVANGTASTATNTSGTWTPVAGAGGSYVLDSSLTGANVTLDASGDIYSDSNVVVNDAGYNVTLIAGNVGIEGHWTASNLIFEQSGTGGILGTVTGNVIAQTGTLNDYSTGSITGTVTVDSGAIFSIYTNSSLARTLGNDLILSGGTVQTGGVDGIATGGTLSRSNGVEVVNIFHVGSGTLHTSAWSGNKTVTYLLVGGGGGGGMNWGGGGGAGGVLQGSVTLSKGSLSVDVGAGGAGATGAADGANGGNTTFNGLSAEGGGGGAQATANTSLIAGANGGSGGGGGTSGVSGVDGSGGTGVTGQGNGGGAGIPSNGYPVPGGGGGAGAAGANATSTAGGAGGNGIQASLSGVDTYYGGGGGGGGYYCASVNQDYGFGAGGLGGGGSGAKNAYAGGLPGAANTGGGGGGGAGSGGPGGAGGSGIAMIAADIAGVSDTALTANTSVTLTGTVTLSARATSTFTQSTTGAKVIAQGVFSGSGSVAEAGAGTLMLTANNTYTGATNVSAGTLQIGNGAAAGSIGRGVINVTGAALTFDLTGNSIQGNSSQLVLDDATVAVLAAGNVTLAGSSTGGTAVIISGDETMNASGGSLTILGNGIDRSSVGVDFGAGALIGGIGNVSVLGNLGGTTGGGRRAFIFNGNTTFNALDGGHISLTSAINNVAPDVAFLQSANGVLATSGNVSFNVQSNADVWEAAFDYVDGVGTWNFSSSNGVLTINALAAQSGYGSFGLSAAHPLGLNAESGGAITVNGVAISAGSTSITGGVGTVLIDTNIGLTGNLAIDGGAGSMTLTGTISGPYELTQDSAGTTIVTGSNSYGGTTISAGTLQVGNGGATGTLGAGAVIDDSALVVNYGAAVNLSTVAACTSGITGTGDLTAVSTGALTVDRAIDLSVGNGSILLAAGCGTAAGNTGGGDVMLTSPVSVGAGGTVTVFSGDPNTTTLEGQLSGPGGATRYKTYGADYAATGGAVSGTQNFYYRADDDVSLSAAGTLASKTYDGTADATADISAGAVDVSESAPDGNNISVSSLDTVSAAFGSPHALGVNGSTVEVSFGSTAQSAAGGANWSIAGLAVENLSGNGTINPATLTLTATSQTKSYDGTDSAAGLERVSGLVATDTLGNAALVEAYTSPHALGTDGSTLNVAAPLSNASLAAGSLGYITDYDADYVTAAGTITPANLTVTSIAQNKTYDGTDGAAGLATVSGLVGTDSLSAAALAEAYASPHALGTNGSTVNVAAPLTNASFTSGSIGYVSDYTVTYVTARGTIAPAALDVAAGSNFTLYELPALTLAGMSGTVQPGQGYLSDYAPNVVNNGNLSFAGPGAATLASLIGTGNLVVDADQTLTVTGTFTQKSTTADNDAILIYPGSGSAHQVQQVESGISAVAWERNGPMNGARAVPESPAVSMVDEALCTRPNQGSKVCR